MNVQDPGNQPQIQQQSQAPAQPQPVPDTTPVEKSLWVQLWIDPVIDQLGHDPRSRYVETFWLGVLGPSTTWLLRLFADGLDSQPQGFKLDLAATAGALGLGRKGGRHSPFLRSLDRSCQFGLAQRLTNDEHGKALRVRRSLPPLTMGQTNRLPHHLQALHRSHQEGQLQAATTEQMDRDTKARRLALTLLEIGESYEAAERQLATWQLHGPSAKRALDWAQQRHRSAQAAVTASAFPAS